MRRIKLADLVPNNVRHMLLTEAVVSQSEIDDLVAQAVKIDGQPIDAKDVKDTRKGNGDVNEVDLATAVIIALPPLLKLLGKIIDRFSMAIGISGKAKRAAFRAKMQEIDNIKKKYNLRWDFNPFNDTPEENEAEAEVERLKQEIEKEFGTEAGNFFRDMGKDVLDIYLIPFKAFFYVLSKFTPADHSLRNEKIREKYAKIAYALIMLVVAGKGIMHNLGHLKEIEPAVTAMVEAIETEASIQKVMESGYGAMNLLASLKNKSVKR